MADGGVAPLPIESAAEKTTRRCAKALHPLTQCTWLVQLRPEKGLTCLTLHLSAYSRVACRLRSAALALESAPAPASAPRNTVILLRLL